MRCLATAAVLCAALSIGVGAQAGGEKFGIGSPVPMFKDLPGVDGRKHSLNEYKKDILVLCITCNHCPVAVAYEDRMIAFEKKYGSKVDFVAINVNNGAADKLDKMIVRAQEKGFKFAYLYDATQQIARDLKAKVTPEFYVFDKNRKLVYWGPLDNNQGSPTTSYLADAVDAVASGSLPKVQQTNAKGCGIQYVSK